MKQPCGGEIKKNNKNIIKKQRFKEKMETATLNQVMIKINSLQETVNSIKEELVELKEEIIYPPETKIKPAFAKEVEKKEKEGKFSSYKNINEFFAEIEKDVPSSC